MALFSRSIHPDRPVPLVTSPERSEYLMACPARTGRANWLYVLGLSAAILLILGCARDIGATAESWSPIATGEVIGQDGTSRTAIFVGTKRGEVLALDTETIRTRTTSNEKLSLSQISVDGLLWRFLPASDPPPGNVLGQIAVAENRIYVSVTDRKGKDSILYSLQKDRESSQALAVETGEEWSFPIRGVTVGGPVLAMAGGRWVVIVGSDDGIVYAIDAFTGLLEWQFPQRASQAIGEIWSTPVVDEQRVYFGSLDQKVYALSLINGTLVWSFDTGGAVVARPLLVDGKVIIGSFDLNLYSIDAAAGSGRSILKAKTWFWAGAVTDGKSIYVPSMDGNVYVLDRNGNPKDIFEAEGTIVSTPGIIEADGQTYVVIANESGNIYLFGEGLRTPTTGASGGVPLAGQIGESKIKAPLVGSGKNLFLSTTDGTVRGLVLQGQSLDELWRVDTRN